ncbi:MAG: DUF362 domain-containing protein [Bacteroidales bacterium]|nr:DUF362 domain-containing protein [Bacteroidales bacterium]MCF8345207.1 DUF362 domain-containing protein [Bacteroidales bacterium]MCF8352374.1 DUF362 domain-containing protein [Bacteroidales bacterium]MCF8377030.1 DUF362 domain-containing protein [Bacteroidales bacterium]MCF8400891.1 DUF362 domain-containing protein [Bacteroidales bacterium]
MGNNLSRRDFVKSTAAIGAASLLGGGIISRMATAAIPAGKAEISVVKGADYFNNTQKAIKMIGGMRKFVRKGQKVGLLVNSDFEIPGAYVNPDIVLAVIDLCKQTGASEIRCIQNIKPEFWQRSSYYEEFKKQIAGLKIETKNQFPSEFDEENFTKLQGIPGAKNLTGEVEVSNAILNCDVLINIPIAKHHALTHYTGALKNMMGVGTRKTNVFYHLGSDERNNPNFLGQCIADINTLKRSDLVVVDATHFITSNGPVGPGDERREDIIVAGSDIVAVDALCCTYLDYRAEEINAIQKAYEMGLGEIDYKKLKIKELNA